VVCKLETGRTDFVGDRMSKDAIHHRMTTYIHKYIHTCMHAVSIGTRDGASSAPFARNSYRFRVLLVYLLVV
jgi:hypothetical protein